MSNWTSSFAVAVSAGLFIFSIFCSNASIAWSWFRVALAAGMDTFPRSRTETSYSFNAPPAIRGCFGRALLPSSGFPVGLQTKHGRMVCVQNFPVAQVHVHAAGQARIEAANGAHDIYALKFVRTVFLEDRCILYRVFVGAGRPINIPGVGVPRRGRIRVIVRDLVILDHDVVGQDAADSFVETTANGAFRHFEVGPGFGAASMQFGERLLAEV